MSSVPYLRDYLRPSRARVAATIVCLVTDAVLAVGQALATVAVLMAFVDRSGGLGPALACAVLVMAARALLQHLVSGQLDRVALECAGILRQRLLSASLGHTRYGNDQLALLATEGISKLDPLVRTYFPSLVRAVVVPPLMLGVVWFYDPRSALIAALTLPLLPVFGALIGVSISRLVRRQWFALGHLTERFNDLVRGLPTLVSYGRHREASAEIAEVSGRHGAATTRALRAAFLTSTAFELISAMSLGIAAVGIGLRLVSGDMELAAGLTVLLLMPEAYAPVRQLGAEFHAAADGTDVLRRARMHPRAASTRPKAGSASNTPPALRIERLSLGFAEDRPIVSDLSARLPRTGLVVIEGPSGCGKSTLLAAIAGDIAPRLGQILVDDMDLRDIDHEWWSRQLTWTPQEPWIVAGTLRENLSAASDAEALRLLARLRLDFPGAGLDAEISEGGWNLSSGQRARIAMARALLTPRTIHVLDEPTAHLDAAAESAAITLLRERAESSLIIAASHRGALISAADEVLTLGTRADAEIANDEAPEPSAARASAATSGAAAPPTRRLPPQAPVALGVLATLAGFLLTATAGWLIVRAAEQPPLMSLMIAIVAVRALALARPALQYFERLASHDAALRRLTGLRQRVFDDLVPLVPGRLGPRPAAVLDAALHDTDTVAHGRLRSRHPLTITAATGVALVAVFAFAGAAPFAWATAGLAAIFVGAYALARAAVRDRSARLSEASTATYLATRAFVDHRDQFRRWGIGGDRLARVRVADAAQAGAARAAHRPTSAIQLAANLASLAVLWLGLASAPVLAAPVTAFLVLLLMSFHHLGVPLVAAGANAAHVEVARGRLLRLGRATPAVDEAREPEALPPRLSTAGATPLTARWRSLDGTSSPRLTLPAVAATTRDHLCITGPSGSGKSTLAALLARHIDPDSGVVRLGRHDIRGYSIDDVRGASAAASSQPYLFSSSVHDNVRIGNPALTEIEAVEALSRAGLSGWLASLPQGVRTPIGVGGRALSGGERGRLGIARALASGRGIVILDEPAAHLDRGTGERVMASVISRVRAEGAILIVLGHEFPGMDAEGRTVHLSAESAKPGKDLGRPTERTVESGRAIGTLGSAARPAGG